jgi:murein DD-endopeptidase MepM/ murein hydrolase activator NlpD
MRRPTLEPVRSVPFRRRLRVLGSCLLLLSLFAGLLGTPVATGDDLADAIARQKALQAKIAAEKREVAKLSAKQASLGGEIAATQRTLRGINTDLAAVKARVATIAANIALTRASYQDLVNQLADIDQQLRGLEEEETRRRQALFDRKELLAARIREAYSVGQTTLLETFLSSQSFSDVVTQVGYYVDVGTQDEALAAQIAGDVRDIASLHQAVLGVRASTETLRDGVVAQKDQLDAQLVQLKAAEAAVRALQKKAQAQLDAQRGRYDELASNKATLAAAIRRAAAAKAALQRRIDRLVAAQRTRGRIPSAYNGTLSWPMGGDISQEFGCTGVIFEPRVGNCSHFHQGIDVVAPYGTPIRAAGPGVVVYVGWNYADGYDPAWIVIIAHSSALQTWYAHMTPTAPSGIRAGASVTEGQIIGYEGNTGHSTGAHLHWAVRFNGTFANPRLFL